jgi:UDP-glucose 4-epimerase
MHIMLTGASGFIGQVLSRRLVGQGHRVTVLLRQRAHIFDQTTCLEYVLGSGANLIFPERIDAVVHLAQSRAYRSFPTDVAEMFRVNIAGTQELLCAAAVAGASRFCLVSSGTVYEPFAQALDERAPLSPSSYLGASKLAAELIANPFGALFPVSVLRLFCPYGPGQTARLVPDLIRRVKNGEAVTLPEQGGGMVFAPTYVDDVCDVITNALEQSWAGVFNVASPESLSIEAAAKIIGKSLGRPPYFARQLIGAPLVVPVLTKMTERYDLSRFRSFAEGIATTIEQQR